MVNGAVFRLFIRDNLVYILMEKIVSIEKWIDLNNGNALRIRGRGRENLKYPVSVNV